MNEKVNTGSNAPEDYEFMALPVTTKPNNDPKQPPVPPTVGKYLHVESVEQYLAAWKLRAGPFTTVDEITDRHFRHTAATLKFLSQAVESRRSLLPKNFLTQLPVTILDYDDSDQERQLESDAAKGIKLVDYRLSGKLVNFRSTATTLQFETSTREYFLSELARGDFNHDGFEDSLVLVYWHYLEGTGRGGHPRLVQQLPGKPLTVIPFPLP